MDLWLSIAGSVFLSAVFVRSGRPLLRVWVRKQVRSQRGWRVANRARAWRFLVVASVLLPQAALGLGGKSPFWGLPVLFAVPFSYRLWLRYRARLAREAFEQSSLTYLHALRGLVRAGLDLSSALFELSRSSRTPFARSMARSLEAFGKGLALGSCLSRVERASQGLTGIGLRSLYLAYRQGTSLEPVLDGVITLVESDRESRLRIAEQRRQASCQALIGLVIPWVVMGALALSQPGWVDRFLTPEGMVGLLTVCLIQALGFYLIGRSTDFGSEG